MCGRFAQFALPEDLESFFEVPAGFDFPPARYNVAPGSEVLAIRIGSDGQPAFVRLRWGLIPSWAKDAKIGYRTINARAETVAEKPAFRSAYKSRRCLIPADGFYEWKPTEHGKQPYFISRKDGQPLALAGLWEAWTDQATGERILSTTIIVTDANSLLRDIHDRMPVIVEKQDFETWLDPSLKPSDGPARLLRPSDPDALTARPVSTRVNKPTEEGPELIQAWP